MDFTILDTETASLHGGVVEIAWLRINDKLEVIDEFQSLVNPERPIDPGAFAIHGISEEDVAWSPTLAMIAEKITWPVYMIAHNCVTGDHEVLTPEGWVRFDSITSDTAKVAIWQIDGSVIFADSLVVRKQHTGDMLKYDSIFHCGIYTAEHKAVYTTAGSLLKGKLPNWRTTTVAELAKLGPNSVVIPSSGVLNSARVHDVPDALIQLLEAARADAHISNLGNSIRFNLKKQRKIDRLLSLLTELGMAYSLNERVTDKDVKVVALLEHPYRDWIVRILGTSKGKAVTAKFLEFDAHQRQVWLDELEFWDGSKPGAEPEGNKRQVVLYTANSEEADWIQTMVCLSGKTSKVTHDIPNTRGFSRSDGTLSRVTMRANNYVKTLYRPEVVDFSGTVYCLTTLTGAFLVRRNGAVWVTGNCSFDARMVKPHIIPETTLCTLSLSRQYIKGTTNHKLPTLKQELKLPEQRSHSALGDVYTVLDLLRFLMPLTGRTLEQMFHAGNTPRVMLYMPFGVHKGKPILEVPKGYRDWLRGQPDLPAELAYTLNLHKDI